MFRACWARALSWREPRCTNMVTFDRTRTAHHVSRRLQVVREHKTRLEMGRRQPSRHHSKKMAQPKSVHPDHGNPYEPAGFAYHQYFNPQTEQLGWAEVSEWGIQRLNSKPTLESSRSGETAPLSGSAEWEAKCRRAFEWSRGQSMENLWLGWQAKCDES